MAFSQWAINQTTPTQQFITLEPSDPIVGTSSLRAEQLSPTSFQAWVVTLSNSSGLTKGLLRGKIRTLFKLVSAAQAVSTHSWGIWCMGSFSETMQTVGTGYRLDIDNTGGANNVEINKFDHGLDDSTVTLIGSAGTITFVTGDTICIELEWDSTSGTQVDFVFRQGVMLDFSDLSDILSVSDTTAPLVSSNSEGLFGRCNSFTGDYLARFDQTTITETI